jgi:hypothetical protein
MSLWHPNELLFPLKPLKNVAYIANDRKISLRRDKDTGAGAITYELTRRRDSEQRSVRMRLKARWQVEEKIVPTSDGNDSGKPLVSWVSPHPGPPAV